MYNEICKNIIEFFTPGYHCEDIDDMGCSLINALAAMHNLEHDTTKYKKCCVFSVNSDKPYNFILLSYHDACKKFSMTTDTVVYNGLSYRVYVLPHIHCNFVDVQETCRLISLVTTLIISDIVKTYDTFITDNPSIKQIVEFYAIHLIPINVIYSILKDELKADYDTIKESITSLFAVTEDDLNAYNKKRSKSELIAAVGLLKIIGNNIDRLIELINNRGIYCLFDNSEIVTDFENIKPELEELKKKIYGDSLGKVFDNLFGQLF